MARLLFSTLTLIIFGSMVSAQGSYQIQSGDTLIIEVLEDASLNNRALVLPDGSITVPLVGSIAASGQTLSAVQSSIVAALAPNFASAPNVFVTVGSLSERSVGGATVHVFVMGAINSPGKIHIAKGTNILQFLAEASGFTRFAAKKRIQVRRTDSNTGKSMVLNFNYQAVENGSAVGNLIVLRNNDVILVPERRLFE